MVSFFSIVRLTYFFQTPDWRRSGAKLFNPCKVRPDMKIFFLDYFRRTTSKSLKENLAFALSEFFSASQQDKLASLLCYSGSGRISFSITSSRCVNTAQSTGWVSHLWVQTIFPCTCEPSPTLSIQRWELPVKSPTVRPIIRIAPVFMAIL